MIYFTLIHMSGRISTELTVIELGTERKSFRSGLAKTVQGKQHVCCTHSQLVADVVST